MYFKNKFIKFKFFLFDKTSHIIIYIFDLLIIFFNYILSNPGIFYLYNFLNYWVEINIKTQI
jgi:hypothetical protein